MYDVVLHHYSLYFSYIVLSLDASSRPTNLIRPIVKEMFNATSAIFFSQLDREDVNTVACTTTGTFSSLFATGRPKYNLTT